MLESASIKGLWGNLYPQPVKKKIKRISIFTIAYMHVTNDKLQMIKVNRNWYLTAAMTWV